MTPAGGIVAFLRPRCRRFLVAHARSQQEPALKPPPAFGKAIDGVPMVIVENGKPLRERMRRARVSEGDVLESARQSQGLERMDQIKYAVLEISGSISIIPKR